MKGSIQEQEERRRAEVLEERLSRIERRQDLLLRALHATIEDLLMAGDFPPLLEEMAHLRDEIGAQIEGE